MTETTEIARPETDEYDAYYSAYVARVEGDNVIDVLVRQGDQVQALLAGLSEGEASYRYAPGKWSVREVLGHLCDTERVFAYRALCIARGDSQALPGMDQDAYVAAADFDGRSTESLKAELAAVRSATLSLFECLEPNSWPRLGTANGVRVSVRALAFIIAGHEAHHMAVLGERYNLEV